MPYCSGVCGRYTHKKKSGEKWYSNGVKRCNFCKVFMKINGKKCPCCTSTLRTQGRGSDVKRERDVGRIEL